LMDWTQLAVVLGTTTLLCWLAAGLAAVFHGHEFSQARTHKIPDLVTFGLAGVGVAAARAMTMVMLLP
jgi:hypothetical protein